MATAKRLSHEGHRVVLHGRSSAKLKAAAEQIGTTRTFQADLSSVQGARDLAEAVKADANTLDVLINNAGVYKAAEPITPDGFDLRFMVNTIAPYALTQALLPILGDHSRVVNLSSAAQAPYDLAALTGDKRLDTREAYAQSKLAIAAWTVELAAKNPRGPAFYAINPGSLLATSMVKEGFGVSGSDIGIGVDILTRASLSAEFDGKSGSYFDNDAGSFSDPHPFAMVQPNRSALVDVLENLVS